MRVSMRGKHGSSLHYRRKPDSGLRHERLRACCHADLQNKIALGTGAPPGIGRAIAAAFASSLITLAVVVPMRPGAAQGER